MKQQVFMSMMFCIILLMGVSALEADIGTGVDADIESELDVQVKSQSGARMDSGEYNNENEGSANSETVLEISGIDVRTNLKVENNDSRARVKLSNGRNAEIKVMPNTASANAIAALRVNACSSNTGCEIMLKEVSQNNEAKAVYEVETQKQYKVFGLFNAYANVRAQVDAESGTVIAAEKPWWTNFSSEVKGNADAQIEG